jgi:hypothetical protein
VFAAVLRSDYAALHSHAVNAPFFPSPRTQCERDMQIEHTVNTRLRRRPRHRPRRHWCRHCHCGHCPCCRMPCRYRSGGRIRGPSRFRSRSRARGSRQHCRVVLTREIAIPCDISLTQVTTLPLLAITERFEDPSRCTHERTSTKLPSPVLSPPPR